MDIQSLTSAHLKQAISLLAKKEALQEQLDSLDKQITSLLGGSTLVAPRKEKAAPAKVKTGKKRVTKSRGRGALKESILDALRAAGASGISIKDLVDKLGSKSANLHAWFNMTGKKMPSIKKIGRGIYRLDE